LQTTLQANPAGQLMVVLLHDEAAVQSMVQIPF
jgi:hypothetical protein